ADGPGALDAVAKHRPDVLVLDYSMPGLGAPEILESLRDKQSGLKILVLTVHESIHYCVKALECGAHGYVIKSAAVGELVDAIKAVSAGEIHISPKVSQKVMQQLRQPKKERVGLDALSQREFELLRVL